MLSIIRKHNLPMEFPDAVQRDAERIPETIEDAGFAIDHLDSYYFKAEPKPFGYTFEGHAVKS